MSSYHLEHLKYPDTFDKLDIRSKGSKVECETSRINPDYSIYLSKCKVNGKLVKDNKNKDGYYHFGTLKMTNMEYVDTYGKNLEDALKKYHDEHNEYPSDYTTLTLEELDKDVSCSVDINPDGTVYLYNCKVDNEDVVDNNKEVYVYGNLYATTVLLKKTNNKSITAYTEGNTHEMYTFDHEVTEQTPALTDYRYIGNEPYNYVKFNGDEIWRIIGVFDTEDGNNKWDRRIKLIRDDSIENITWNSTNENEWVGSTIQLYFNEEFGIDSYSNKMIDSVKNYLGGVIAYPNGEDFYQAERSKLVYNERNTSPYVSDYILTYSFGIDTICYNTPTNCKTNTGANPSSGWLYSGLIKWTIDLFNNDSNRIYMISANGHIYYVASNLSYNGTPTLYLKPDVKIKSGDGSIDSPYEFEL